MAWEVIVDILLNCPELRRQHNLFPDMFSMNKVPFKKYNLDSKREFCTAAQRGFDQISQQIPDHLLQKLRKQYDGWWFIDKDCKEYDLSEEEEEEEQEELDTHRKRLLAHQEPNEDQQKPEKKPKQSDEEKSIVKTDVVRIWWPRILFHYLLREIIFFTHACEG